jgi:hypothetical protein
MLWAILSLPGIDERRDPIWFGMISDPDHSDDEAIPVVGLQLSGALSHR